MLEAPQKSQEGAQEVTSVPLTKDVPQPKSAIHFEFEDVGGRDIPSAKKGLSKDRPSSTAASSPFDGGASVYYNNLWGFPQLSKVFVISCRFECVVLYLVSEPISIITVNI